MGNSDKETVLVRVYGNKTDLLIDRKAETRWAKINCKIAKLNVENAVTIEMSYRMLLPQNQFYYTLVTNLLNSLL